MSNILKYLNLEKRKEEGRLCDRGFVPPPSLLRAVFQIDIPDNQLEKYRKIYKKNCKELIKKYLDRIYLNRETESYASEIARQSLKIKNKMQESISKTMSKARETIKKSIYKCINESNKHLQSFRPKFVWKGSVDNSFKKFVETTLNVAYTSIINGCLTWSQWLIFTDEGQHLLELTIQGNKTEQIFGIATLFAYLTQIYITSGYDDGIFRKELLEILPTIDDILEKFPMLKSPFYKTVAGMITSKVFLWAFSKIMMRYGVPSQFFVDFQKIDPSESIYFGSNSSDEKEEKE